MPAMAEAMFGFLHRLPDGVQIVAGRDDGKQQYERASKRANDGK